MFVSKLKLSNIFVVIACLIFLNNCSSSVNLSSDGYYESSEEDKDSSKQGNAGSNSGVQLPDDLDDKIGDSKKNYQFKSHEFSFGSIDLLSPLNVVFLVDNSKSMTLYQSKLSEVANTFVKSFSNLPFNFTVSTYSTTFLPYNFGPAPSNWISQYNSRPKADALTGAFSELTLRYLDGSGLDTGLIKPSGNNYTYIIEPKERDALLNVNLTGGQVGDNIYVDVGEKIAKSINMGTTGSDEEFTLTNLLRIVKKLSGQRVAVFALTNEGSSTNSVNEVSHALSSYSVKQTEDATKTRYVYSTKNDAYPNNKYVDAARYTYSYVASTVAFSYQKNVEGIPTTLSTTLNRANCQGDILCNLKDIDTKQACNSAQISAIEPLVSGLLSGSITNCTISMSVKQTNWDLVQDPTVDWTKQMIYNGLKYENLADYFLKVHKRIVTNAVRITLYAFIFPALNQQVVATAIDPMLSLTTDKKSSEEHLAKIIISRIKESIGEQNFYISSIIRDKVADKGLECPSELGWSYAEGLAEVSRVLNGHITSLCSTNYQAAIDGIRRFITKSSQTSYNLKFTTGEYIHKIFIISSLGQKIELTPNMSLAPGSGNTQVDVIKITDDANGVEYRLEFEESFLKENGYDVRAPEQTQFAIETRKEVKD